MSINKLEDFYKDVRDLLDKYNLVIECSDNYNGHGEWCGYLFTLRSREAVNDKFPICVNSIEEFIDNLSL